MRRSVIPAACACLAVACTPARYRPAPLDVTYQLPVGVQRVDPQPPTSPSQVPVAHPMDGELQLAEVIESVISRYPPYLSTLLERDVASGRLTQAMGAFDTNLAARLGSQVQGFYESTTAQGLLEQPLTTGDTIYGGYRITDGFLPDYNRNRTQDNGEFVVGGRFPLLRNRAIDPRRAGVRQADIDRELVDPTIARARIDFVRAAAVSYYSWVAAGDRLAVARALLRLATDRSAALARGVERQFLAPVDVTDNDRLIAQRQVFVVRAERQLQQSALELSLFLRAPDDTPIVPGEERLPKTLDVSPAPALGPLEDDLAQAFRLRPELRRFQLLLDRVATDRDLADNQTLPDLDLVVEAVRSLSDGPYRDREDLELFVGGELRLPLQRRDAFGRLEQATARLNQLRLEERFARDRIANEVADARSALAAAYGQLEATRRNVQLALELVAAEQRAFELGRSDLLRIQLRELQLADAQVLDVDARLGFDRARADYRAVLGTDAIPPPGP